MLRRLAASLLVFSLPLAGAGNPVELAGVRGGLVVHVGCGDGTTTAVMRVNERYIVHGLDTDPANVAKAREHIRSLGLYGPVSVDTFDGERLPYADDMVNLIQVSGVGCQVSAEEITRVLVPGGTAIFLDARPRHQSPSGTVRGRHGTSNTFDKPIPEGLDDWSHYLHGPGNNPVSKDTAVAPIGSLKWQCGPLWSRSHEFTSSLSILVSAGGRVFYVVDEGITSITTPEMPERWVLIARDAFNGKALWRMPLPEWRSRLGKNTALRSVPATAQRCLVADVERVFVSSRLGGPIMAVDAATGDVLETYDATDGTREFVKTGSAIVFYGEPAGKRPGMVACLGLKTGKRLWAAPQDGYKAESLGATEKYVAYHNGQTLVCRDFTTGKELWRTKEASRRHATYIIHDDLVLDCGSNLITARKAKTGDVLWQAKTGGKAMRGNDSFVMRGCVWHAAGDGIVGYDLATGKPAKTLDPRDVQSDGHHLRCYRAKATENYLITQYRGVEFIGVDGRGNSQTDWTRGACSFGVVPANGLLYVPPNPCFCYPGVKVRGLNAFGVGSGEWRVASGRGRGARLVRGGAYGGEFKSQISDLRGDRGTRGSDSSADRKSQIADLRGDRAERDLDPEADRRATDPDSETVRNPQSNWPTYRHDAMRHGSTGSEVPARVAVRWDVALGGKITPPVVAAGKVYVAVKDQHAVCALDAATGEALWRFTAGARVDSPPTIHAGLALFGCTDGHLYCVTADQGELVWRFRAAPAERMIMIRDQLESAWPVHGSVLVEDGVVYCTAGRSSMLDGGIWLYGLEPATGKVLYETNVDTLKKVREDIEGQPSIPSYVMEGTHADILVSEGDHIYMGPMTFDRELKRRDWRYAMDTNGTTVAMDISRAPYISMNSELQKEGYETFRSFHRYQEKAWPQMTREYKAKHGGLNLGDLETGLHIAPTAGFLDDSWFNRTYWMYSTCWPGWYHAHRAAKTGQFLVVGRERTYALQAYADRNRQSPLFFPATRGYLLTADANDNEPALDFKTRGATKGLGFTRAKPPEWYDWVPIRIRAMVEAGEILFVAGVPDAVPADDPMAAFEGRCGAMLQALWARDGRIVYQTNLHAPPVFDGLIAAAGCLFLSTESNRIVCLAGATEQWSSEERNALTRLQVEQRARRKTHEEEARNRKFGRGGARTGAPAKGGVKRGGRLPATGALPRDGWRVAYASTVEPSQPAFAPGKVLDGNPMTSWHSRWSKGRDPHPHELVIDLGKVQTCRAIHYLPRQDRAQNGRIKQYAVYVGADGKTWGEPVAKGACGNAVDEQRIRFEPVAARYIRLVVQSGYDENLTAIAELNVVGP